MSTIVVLMSIDVPARANSVQSNKMSWLGSLGVHAAGSTRPPVAKKTGNFCPTATYARPPLRRAGSCRVSLVPFDGRAIEASGAGTFDPLDGKLKACQVPPEST